MTIKELRNQVATLHFLAVKLGILAEGEKTHLEEGSKFYGRAFRLARLTPESSAHHRHPLGDYLGMTKPEASDAVRHILTALYAAEKAVSDRVFDRVWVTFEDLTCGAARVPRAVLRSGARGVGQSAVGG